MAVILSPTQPSGESAWFFKNQDRIRAAVQKMGNINPFVIPHCRVVQHYSIEKVFRLFGELAEWVPHGLNVSRENFIRDAARDMVLTESFGKPKVHGLTEICCCVKMHLRVNGLKELPDELKCIGEDYFNNIHVYARLVEKLAYAVKRRPLDFMSGLRLRQEFIDKIVGQFVHYHFWFMVKTRNYPLKHLRIVG